MADNFKYAQLQPFSLAGAGAVIGATTITLKSFATIDSDGVTGLLEMTDFGTIGFGTLQPGEGTLEEQISFTGVTQNVNGTATLTGVKTVDFLYPYTQTSGLAKTHAGSTSFVISNTSGFYDELTSKDNDETINGVWTFNTPPNTPSDPVTMDDLARKSWVLSVVNGGDITTNALIEAGTAGETLVAGNLVYLKSTDARWWKCDADTASTVNAVQLGIAQGSGTAGNPISGGVLRKGLDTNQSGGSIGLAYAGNTAGAIVTSPGTTTKVVGEFTSATDVVFDPYFSSLPSQSEKDALVGSSGTPPSSSNKFVDHALAATTATAGIAEQATLAEVNAGTATGSQGNLFINPAAPGSYGMGVGPATVAKTYFNMQLPFLLYTGNNGGATETDFVNWDRSSADVEVPPMGTHVNFVAVGADHIDAEIFATSSELISFASTNKILLDFWAKLPATATGDIIMGFGTNFELGYTDTTTDRVVFAMSAAGTIYSVITKATVGTSATDISSGITNTVWNNYRIELDLSNNALFYVNGTLKATMSGANLPSTGNIHVGFGRSNTALFKAMAPNISLEMNP